MAKQDIKNFTLEELKRDLDKIKELPYRANQIFFWLYQRGTSDFSDMHNIPAPLQEKLGEFYCISGLDPCEHLKSKDGTEKFLFKLCDGNFIETVLLYTDQRMTVCLSTQVGCKYACLFCASGGRGFIRNLAPSEITNQVVFLQYGLKKRITNFVFMGMGEPLDNFENLSKAISIMNEPQGMRIAARRITVSTCGIIPAIAKLKNLKLQINLAISLHATNDKLRSQLMPINRRYPLEKLIRACEDFIKATGRMITLEYILIKAKNDSLQDADGLALIAERLNSKVNLLAYSNVCYRGFRPPTKKDTDVFMKRLKEKRIKVTLRKSKGSDIQAACGQLAGRKQINYK